MLESDLETIRNNLKKFFKLLSGRTLELYFKNTELGELSKIKLKGYVADSILESMVKSEEGVSLFVSFFSDYVKSCTLWYKLFCELVRALGYEDFPSVIFKLVKLDDVVDSSKIDVNFFKFQIRTCFDLCLIDARSILLSTYLKARDLPKVVYYTTSEFAKRLIQVMEKQNEDWLKILREIYYFYENIFLKENLEEMIRGLKKIIGCFIEMAERLQIAQEFIIPHKSWKELLIEDIQNLGEKIEEIKKEISVIAEYRIEYYEHGLNATLFLLRMLWGSEELVLKKLEGWARAQLSTEELLPKEFKLEDLAFGLMGAREEFNLVDQAMEVLKEKIGVLGEAARALGSQALQNLYEEIAETISGHGSFWEETYDSLLSIQELTAKILENK
jgi:hypothetical protein